MSVPAHRQFLSPRNDLVFKLLMERSRSLLDSMLSAVLGRAVSVEEVLNPGIQGDTPAEKLMQVDLRVKFKDGARAFVEMQVSVYPSLTERFVAYLCREYGSQLPRGGNYGELTPAIGVVWQAGALDPRHGFHEVFVLQGQNRGQVLTGVLSLHLLQLGLLPASSALGPEGTEAERALQLWGRFFSANSQSDLQSLLQEEPKMSDAVKLLEAITANPELVRQAQEREEAEFFQQLAFRMTRAEATRQGHAEGVLKGKLDALGLMLEAKFGMAAARPLLEKLQNPTEAELDNILRSAVLSSSLEELLARL